MSTSNQQRVLVIQNTAEQLCTYAIRWALHGLSLKAGDKVKFLGVVQPFRTSNTSPLMGCITLVRERSKLHSSATIKKKQEAIEKKISKKQEEYQNNAQIKELRQIYEQQQSELEIAVEAGHPLQDVIVQAAMHLDATCVILVRLMRIDQKYLLEKLSCAILRMKHDCSIEHVRQMKATEMEEIPVDESQSSNTNIDLFSTSERPREIFENFICSVCKNTRPIFGFFKDFAYKELETATNGFSPHFLLPEHGKGIYKGKLPNGVCIIVREHSFYSNLVRKHDSAKIKEDEFKEEVQILRKARHENVAMLLGSCSEDGHRLLVYEYVCNGSLDQHLSRRNKELTWERRMKIALGAAKGLEYLNRKNINGNMRPNNILITHDHQPLLTNFGLTRNQYEESEHSSGSSATRFNYVAPEYKEIGRESSKNDVHSFGVILLELITGRRTAKDTNGQSFLRWARPLLNERMYGDLIDPKVLDSDVHQLFWMVRVVEKCLHWDPDRRHPIERVVKNITDIIHGRDIKGFSPPESDLIKQITRW